MLRRFHPAAAAALAGLLALGGCSSADKALETTAPGQLHEQARASLRTGDIAGAIRLLEAIEARYPFAPEARQAEIDLMYAYYRAGQDESAVDAADTFIRENPTHPRVDYAHYIKGLVYFERTPNILERSFDANLNARPPQDARRSFQSFQTLIQRYPDSEYVHDARQRMVYLRNRLAEYEIHVADFYLRRGAYVAALARTKFCIENYDGAPSVRRALELQIAAYEGLGLADLAKQTRDVYALNFPDQQVRPVKQRWWKFW